MANRRDFLKLLCTAGIAAAVPQLSHAKEKSSNPNIILIMADDMGMEAVSSYGSQTYKTPHLDSLASRGTRFTKCFAMPICTPSRVKIMTGQHTFDCYRDFGTSPTGKRTFGNLLSDAGYATACYGKWQMKAVRPDQVGFDEYLCANKGIPGVKGDRYRGGTYGDHTQQAVSFSSRPDYQGKPKSAFGPDLLVYRMKDFMSRQVENKKPFFVYYPMVLVHWPFIRTPESNGGSQQELFEGMVAYADKLVGEIIAHVDALGQRDNTLILFTADNGTYPGLVGTMADGSLWEGAKSTPMRPGQHVPLVAAMGDGTGRVSDTLIDFTDIMPTLADAGASKVDLVKDYNCHGRSFLPEITGTGQTKEKKYSICWYSSVVATRPYNEAVFVTDGRHKLYPGGTLFNIEEDPFEYSPFYPENDSKQSKAARSDLKAFWDASLEKFPNLKAKIIPKPRIIGSWKNDQVPDAGTVEMEWDIGMHLKAKGITGDFTIEIVQYYGFSNIEISNLALYSGEELLARSEPEKGNTSYMNAGKTYPYCSEGKNKFKFKVASLDENGKYILKATFARGEVRNRFNVASSTNGYVYLMDTAKPKR